LEVWVVEEIIATQHSQERRFEVCINRIDKVVEMRRQLLG